MMWRRFKSDGGTAAVEFALIAPICVLLVSGVFEFTYRFKVADEFERYAFQAGDYLSREDALTSSEIARVTRGTKYSVRRSVVVWPNRSVKEEAKVNSASMRNTLRLGFSRPRASDRSISPRLAPCCRRHRRRGAPSSS